MTYDVVVIGGSYAGLSAALYAARGRRSVAVIDAGAPRNRFSPKSHGFFGQDATSPADMLARARDDLSRYPAVELIADTATEASGEAGACTVSIADRAPVQASKLILATGIIDVLPDRARPSGAVGRERAALPLLPRLRTCRWATRGAGRKRRGDPPCPPDRELGPTTLFLPPDVAGQDAALAALRDAGARVERGRPIALRGDGLTLSAIELASGEQVPVEALFVMPGLRLASPLAEQLGCELADAPNGRIVKVDGAMRTSVSGIYACGNAARAFGNAMLAAADGVTAGGSANYAAIFGEPAR